MLPNDIIVLALMVVLRGEDITLKIMEDMPPELKKLIWAEHLKNFKAGLEWVEKIGELLKGFKGVES